MTKVLGTILFARVDHIYWSFGWVLLPWLPWTVGYFDDYGFKLTDTRRMHNCTASGVY